MTAAAQTSGLNNPPTGVDRLLDLARWLVALLFIHWLIAVGRDLADVPDEALPARRFGITDVPLIRSRIARGLRRAVEFEAELLAHPIQRGMPESVRRAIAATLIDICRDLGIFRPASSRAIRRTSLHRRVFHSLRRFAGQPARLTRARPTPSPTATGPPARLTAEITSATRVYPWSFSRRGGAPAFAV